MAVCLSSVSGLPNFHHVLGLYYGVGCHAEGLQEACKRPVFRKVLQILARDVDAGETLRDRRTSRRDSRAL
jgi:hypothetical protein